MLRTASEGLSLCWFLRGSIIRARREGSHWPDVWQLRTHGDPPLSGEHSGRNCHHPCIPVLQPREARCLLESTREGLTDGQGERERHSVEPYYSLSLLFMLAATVSHVLFLKLSGDTLDPCWAIVIWLRSHRWPRSLRPGCFTCNTCPFTCRKWAQLKPSKGDAYLGPLLCPGAQSFYPAL